MLGSIGALSEKCISKHSPLQYWGRGFPERPVTIRKNSWKFSLVMARYRLNLDAERKKSFVCGISKIFEPEGFILRELG
jgi:hypothetical protein